MALNSLPMLMGNKDWKVVCITVKKCYLNPTIIHVFQPQLLCIVCNTVIHPLCYTVAIVLCVIWFDLSMKSWSGQFIAITASRSDVEACKSKVWFPAGCNQSAGIPITNASLSYSADCQQNALHDNESHEETTEDHCSWRSDVRYGNTCFWFDPLLVASMFSSRNKVMWLPILSLFLPIGLLEKLLGEFSSNFGNCWVSGQEVDFGVMDSGCFTNIVS